MMALITSDCGARRSLSIKWPYSCNHLGLWFKVKGPELINSYVGESERNVRDLFTRARYNPPKVADITV